MKKFPPKIIRDSFHKVREISRKDALNYKKWEANNRVTFPIHYHSNVKTLVPTLHEKYDKILLQDPFNKKIFPDPPIKVGQNNTFFTLAKVLGS